MRECRFFPWCSYIEAHGHTGDSCRHYQPIPDVDALTKLADEMTVEKGDIWGWSSRIREALGEAQA